MTFTSKPRRVEEVIVTIIAAPLGTAIAWSTYLDVDKGCIALRYGSICAETEPLKFWVRIALEVAVAVGCIGLTYYKARRLIRRRSAWR